MHLSRGFAAEPPVVQNPQGVRRHLLLLRSAAGLRNSHSSVWRPVERGSGPTWDPVNADSDGSDSSGMVDS